MSDKTLEEIAESEGLIYLLNQLFINMVKEEDKEARFNIHNDNWDLVVETLHDERESYVNTNWISVEDRLPESHGLFDMYYHRLRVCFKFNGSIMTEEASWLVGDRFVWQGVDITNLVTDWMNLIPLPEPPKEKKKEECKHDFKLVNGGSFQDRFECQKEGCNYYHN